MGDSHRCSCGTEAAAQICWPIGADTEKRCSSIALQGSSAWLSAWLDDRQGPAVSIGRLED